MDAIDWFGDPDIAKVSQAIARRYDGYVDAEDVRSVLVLWCLENPVTAERVWGSAWWMKNRRLWTIGQRFARKEKSRALGYEVEDEWFYSTAIIRSLLPDAFDDSSEKPQTGIAEQQSKTSNNSAGMEWETMIADLRKGLQSIPDKEFELLWTLYSDQGCSLTSYCETKGWNYRRGVRAERRAMKSLQEALGGENPWKGDTSREPRKPAPEGRRATNTAGAIHG